MHATHLHLDCYAGISGDMLLGALVDLGAPLAEIAAKLAGLPIGPFALRAETTLRGGIRATRVHVEVEEEGHVHRHLSDIYELIDAAGLPPRALARARRAYWLLAQAEARVHGTTPESIHFHEVGAKDAILDVAASALALEYLGIETVSTGSVTTGFGMVRCAHGMMPVPAPATAELLLGLATRPGAIESEMVTPTGAALLRALVGEGLSELEPPPGLGHAHDHGHEHVHGHGHEHGHEHGHGDEGHHHEEAGHSHTHTHGHEAGGHGHTHEHHAREHAHAGHEVHGAHAHSHAHAHAHAHTAAIVFTEMPAPVALETLSPVRIGYGAGGREFPGHANCLRALLCRGAAVPAAPESTATALPVERHQVLLLETEIDDMAPELAGHALERLLAAGAYDVQWQPVQMKKNRPGLRLRVLAEPALEARLAELIFRETSTFGVRRQLIERWCLARRIEQIKTPFGPVPVKLGLWGDELLKASPEYDACRALAAQTNLPLSDIYDLVRRCAAEQLRRP